LAAVNHRSSSQKVSRTEDSPAKASTSAPASKAELKAEKKKKKQKGDENGLKRPLTAYMLFNNHRRPILKDQDNSKLLDLIPHSVIGHWLCLGFPRGRLLIMLGSPPF